MTTKKCPYCLAEVHEAAIVCPYCNSDLGMTVPMKVIAKQNTWEQTTKRSRLVTRIIVGFLFTFFLTCLVVSYILLLNSF